MTFEIEKILNDQNEGLMHVLLGTYDLLLLINGIQNVISCGLCHTFVNLNFYTKLNLMEKVNDINIRAIHFLNL